MSLDFFTSSNKLLFFDVVCNRGVIFSLSSIEQQSKQRIIMLSKSYNIDTNLEPTSSFSLKLASATAKGSLSEKVEVSSSTSTSVSLYTAAFAFDAALRTEINIGTNITIKNDIGGSKTDLPLSLSLPQVSLSLNQTGTSTINTHGYYSLTDFLNNLTNSKVFNIPSANGISYQKEAGEYSRYTIYSTQDYRNGYVLHSNKNIKLTDSNADLVKTLPRAAPLAAVVAPFASLVSSFCANGNPIPEETSTGNEQTASDNCIAYEMSNNTRNVALSVVWPQENDKDKNDGSNNVDCILNIKDMLRVDVPVFKTDSETEISFFTCHFYGNCTLTKIVSEEVTYFKKDAVSIPKKIQKLGESSPSESSYADDDVHKNLTLLFSVSVPANDKKADLSILKDAVINFSLPVSSSNENGSKLDFKMKIIDLTENSITFQEQSFKDEQLSYSYVYKEGGKETCKSIDKKDVIFNVYASQSEEADNDLRQRTGITLNLINGDSEKEVFDLPFSTYSGKTVIALDSTNKYKFYDLLYLLETNGITNKDDSYEISNFLISGETTNSFKSQYLVKFESGKGELITTKEEHTIEFSLTLENDEHLDTIPWKLKITKEDEEFLFPGKKDSTGSDDLRELLGKTLCIRKMESSKDFFNDLRGKCIYKYIFFKIYLNEYGNFVIKEIPVFQGSDISMLVASEYEDQSNSVKTGFGLSVGASTFGLLSVFAFAPVLGTLYSKSWQGKSGLTIDASADKVRGSIYSLAKNQNSLISGEAKIAMKIDNGETKAELSAKEKILISNGKYDLELSNNNSFKIDDKQGSGVKFSGNTIVITHGGSILTIKDDGKLNFSMSQNVNFDMNSEGISDTVGTASKKINWKDL